MTEEEKAVMEAEAQAALVAAEAKAKEAQDKADKESLEKEGLVAELIELRKKKGVSPEEHASALKVKDEEIEKLKKQIADATAKAAAAVMDNSAATPVVTSTPPASTPSPLTPEQEELRKTKGWTVEKYLAMKKKYPRVVL